VPGLPGLTATVFDLPHVTGFAARMIAAAELSGRITAAAGGLFAIGDFVGHRSPASTAIYAKVAIEPLRQVALGDGEQVLA
jgi:hypothetical protein